jgi:hypothetical protein
MPFSPYEMHNRVQPCCSKHGRGRHPVHNCCCAAAAVLLAGGASAAACHCLSAAQPPQVATAWYARSMLHAQLLLRLCCRRARAC